MEIAVYYIIYKITNKNNGKIYIGKHKTKNLNDGYMGSGKRLKDAIKHHGIQSFCKEILYQFDNEEEMNSKEAELVSETFIQQETNYNMCIGGNGGFNYINTKDIVKFKGKNHSDDSKKKMGHKNNNHFFGKHHDEYTKQKIGENTSKKLRGKPKSEEHKRKIAESVKKRLAEKNAGVV